MVLDQLEKSGYLPFLTVIASTDAHVAATIDPCALDSLIEKLRRDERFACGALHGLHADVGGSRIDFRSHRGELGPRSLQIVISRDTGHVYCDIDRFSPYSDVVGFVGHAFVDVFPGLWRKMRGRA